jgi:DNA polymerase I-like protein with 3'-5' exonuclease and polymerase domains
MGKLKLESSDPALNLPHRDLLIEPTFADVMNFMDACEHYKRFNTDLEILNRQVYCMSLATFPWLAITVPFVNRDGQPYWTEEQEVAIWQRYASLMANPEVAKVNQNLVGFDAVFLFQQNNIHTLGPMYDTMIAQHIMYPHFPKGLDFIASYHTREPYWKDEGKIWKVKDFREIPWERFQTYCAKDSAVSLEAWEVLAEEMTQGGYWPTYNMTVEMAPALAYMSTRGLKVNLRGIQQTNVRITEEIREKQAELNEACGKELNVSSYKDCVEYFYHELKLPPYVGPSGSPTTDDKAMARIVRKAGRGSKEAKKVQEIRALRKLKGTYLETELDMDGRLRCSWNPRGTWTGRLSSSKTIWQTGLDLQNLHPNFKGFIVSDMEGK